MDVVSGNWNANIRTHKHFCWGLWSQIAKISRYMVLHGQPQRRQQHYLRRGYNSGYAGGTQPVGGELSSKENRGLWSCNGSKTIIQSDHQRASLLCVYCANLLLPLQLVEVQPTMTYHVRTTWCMVCVRWPQLNLKPTPSLLVHLPPLYNSMSMITPVWYITCENDEKLVIKVNVSYATVTERAWGWIGTM